MPESQFDALSYFRNVLYKIKQSFAHCRLTIVT
jgi:hypothetical protein